MRHPPEQDRGPLAFLDKPKSHSYYQIYDLARLPCHKAAGRGALQPLSTISGLQFSIGLLREGTNAALRIPLPGMR